MLREYLLNGDPTQIRWSNGLSGVQICQFNLTDLSEESLLSLPVQGTPFHLELLFCLGGRLIAESTLTSLSVIEEQGIFFLSDTSKLHTLKVSGNLRGILLSMDMEGAQRGFCSACSYMGLELSTKLVAQNVQVPQGFAALSDTPWTQVLFGYLKKLPEDHQGQYCVFKAVELLYLLCAGVPVFEWDFSPRSDSYTMRSVQDAREYMEQHLSEKITIPALSHRFSVSPTYLKTGFRRMYKMPIHRWLMGQRMKRACHLIRSSNMSIQQIAQAVGYDGVSQFNTVFKQYYGTTPGQFKKMSKTDGLRPFQ